MATYWRWLLAIPALLGTPQAHSAGCDNQTAIWATPETDGVTHLLYGTGAITMWSGIFIEEWRNGKRAWRTKAGWATCSNGQVTCSVSFEDETASDGAIADIEWIDDDNDGLSEFIILAGLRQQLYYGGGARVDWDEGFQPKEYDGMFERAVPSSNVFKFFDCRKEPVALDRSTLFTAHDICEKYKQSDSLEPDQSFPSTPGAVWWMTGERLEGVDLSCEVKSFNKDNTVTAACRKAKADEAQETRLSFQYEGAYLVLGDQRLDICMD